MLLLEIFDRAAKLLPGLQFCFAYFLPFLCNGIISSNLRQDRNKEYLMGLLILVHRESAKMWTYSLIIFVVISETWESFLVSKSKISFSVSCAVTSVKEHLFLPLYLALMIKILGCFLYFSMAFKVIGSNG